MHPTVNTITEFSILTDAELLQLWQEGNERAFEYLYKKYAVKLLTIAMQKTADRAVAEEVVHDAFVELHINKHELPALNSVPAYLYVIIKRKLLDLYRHAQVAGKYHQYMSQRTELGIHNPVSDLLETKELELKLEEEIQKIPAQSRTVFIMRRTHELSNKRIAAELNISENTVEQHMRKALKTLKVAFSGYLHLLLLFIIKLW